MIRRFKTKYAEGKRKYIVQWCDEKHEDREDKYVLLEPKRAQLVNERGQRSGRVKIWRVEY